MSEPAACIQSSLPEPYFQSPNHRFRLYQGDCLHLLHLIPQDTFDLVFADPPYFLSNGGITCHAGKMVSVNKGKWDRSRGFAGNYAFTKEWLSACRRVMKPNATIWISGTSHIIHLVGSALDELGFKILNDITWVKRNPPPNLSCRYFTHATETIIWAGRDRKTRHKFNYQLMRHLAGGKQMKSVWTLDAPSRDEKLFGKHPTQKPLSLLERIIAASSDENDLVLDPFSGSGTTGIAAARMHRIFSGMDHDPEYLNLALLRYESVPQADNPLRIMELVKLHAQPSMSISELAAKLGLTERQVFYYRQAAFMLKLLESSEGLWRLTRAGNELFQLSQPEAASLLARQILALPVVQVTQKIMTRFATAGAQKESLAQILIRATALGHSTAIRRAETLLAWTRWACNTRGDPQATLYGDVPPAPQEPHYALIPEHL